MDLLESSPAAGIRRQLVHARQLLGQGLARAGRHAEALAVMPGVAGMGLHAHRWQRVCGALRGDRWSLAGPMPGRNGLSRPMLTAVRLGQFPSLSIHFPLARSAMLSGADLGLRFCNLPTDLGLIPFPLCLPSPRGVSAPGLGVSAAGCCQAVRGLGPAQRRRAGKGRGGRGRV